MLRALPILLLLVACDDYPTEVVSRCHPDTKASEPFMKDRSQGRKATAEVGKEVFMTRCSGCHGKDGRGGGHDDRGDFRKAAWQEKHSDSDLSNIVTAGRGMKMPGMRLPRFEMKSLLLYIRSLKPAKAPTKKSY